MRSDLVTKVADQSDVTRALAQQVKAQRTAFAHNDTVLAATVELACSAKLPWSDGADPEEIEFHTSPMVGSKAARVQPRAVLTLPPGF